jgi:hypothetical protein
VLRVIRWASTADEVESRQQYAYYVNVKLPGLAGMAGSDARVARHADQPDDAAMQAVSPSSLAAQDRAKVQLS